MGKKVNATFTDIRFTLSMDNQGYRITTVETFKKQPRVRAHLIAFFGSVISPRRAVAWRRGRVSRRGTPF